MTSTDPSSWNTGTQQTHGSSEVQTRGVGFQNPGKLGPSASYDRSPRLLAGKLNECSVGLSRFNVLTNESAFPDYARTGASATHH